MPTASFRSASAFVLVAVVVAAQAAAQYRPPADRWAGYLPPVNSPAEWTGFYRGVLVRDGAAQVVELRIGPAVDGWAVTVDVPDWWGWTELAREARATDDGLLIESMLYGTDFELRRDPTHGDLVGGAIGAARPISAHFRPAPPPEAPVIDEVDFEVESRDGTTLAGTLVLPAGDGPHPAVAWMGGRGGFTRESRSYVGRAYELARRGIAGIVYDSRGRGGSGGSHEDSDLFDRADDAEAVIARAAASRRIDGDRVALFGASAGGWVATIVAGRGSVELAGIVLSAGPVDSVYDQQWHVAEAWLTREGFAPPVVAEAVDYVRLLSGRETGPDVLARLRQMYDVAQDNGWDELLLSGPPDSAQALAGTWARRNRYDPADDLARLDMPLLAFYGENDYVVAPEYNVPKLEAALDAAGNDDVEIVVLRGVGHSMESANGVVALPDGPATAYYFQWNRVPAGYGATMQQWLQRVLASR
jgi:hypothetical protein